MPFAAERSSVSTPEDTVSTVRLKILACAHEFSPAQGSECAVGWHCLTRLARWHDVTVLCASGSQQQPSAYRSAVQDYVREHGPIEGLELVFVDQPRVARLLAALNRKVFGGRGIGFPLLFYGALRCWHRAAYRRALQLAPDRFDVVHHVTPIAFWAGSDLWKLGKPYVWGPVSGAGRLSLKFAAAAGWRTLLFEILRTAFNSFQAHTSIALHRAVRRAALVMTVGREEAELFRRLGAPPPIAMLETAAPAVTLAPGRRRYDGSTKLRLLWSGQHIDRKALPLLFHALTSSRLRERLELHVLGGGPRTEEWQQLARRLGLTSVFWHGQRPHDEALTEMRNADVLVHTSIREGTPHVVLEAMAQGLPIVCHDIAGLSVAVTDRCGIKIPLVDPAASIAAFRATVERLVEEPLLLEGLAAGAAARAAELTWEAKAAEIARVYERCAARPVGVRGTAARAVLSADRSSRSSRAQPAPKID
jgi:glycosyltransferase involved in cell wall biosynthesis